MQKGKNALYVAAGLQAAHGVRINVRSSVYLPDSEAGQAFDPDRQPFRAGQVPSAPKESVTVPLRGALIFLCVLFVFFGTLIIFKGVRRADLSKRITAFNTEIRETEAKNEELATQVRAARDGGRIMDMARELKMKEPNQETTQLVIAPDTRPFEIKTTVQAASSPNTPPDGIMTGSR